MRVLIPTLLLCLMITQLHAQYQRQEYLALQQLYLETDGDNWTNNTGWPTEAEFVSPMMPSNMNLNTWYGVTTNGEGYVTKLRLSSNNLNGSIPWLLSDLSNLTHLNLSDNQLSGSIPGELGNLSKLTSLSLSINNLNGNIPWQLGNLSNLIYLGLSENQLNGSIPRELGNLNNLTHLYLSQNQLNRCYDANLLVLCSKLTHPIFDGNANISYGNNFDAPWEAFCTVGVNACDISNVVLHGNFDNNAIVDGKDLLYWGAAYGYTGPARSSVTTEWTPQYNIKDWDYSINGVNSKHQDANGDSTVDILDLEVLETNYGKTYGIDYFEYHPTDAMFVIKELMIDGNEISFEVHIASDTPINTHGINATVDLSAINYYDIQVDTTDSSLHPDAHIYWYDEEDIIDIALTRTDKNDQIIDGPVVSLVVMTKDVQSLIVPVNGGYVMSAAGELTSIGGSTTYDNLSKDNLSTLVSLGVNHAYCNEMGTAEVYMADAGLYSCVWSTGATTTSIGGLEVGDYSVTVSDGIDSTVIDFDIDWAFTPVEVIIGENEVYIDFEESPLSEDVEISLDGGQSYMPPIREDVSYLLPSGNYQIWIQRTSDECPTYLTDNIVRPLPPPFSAYLINSLGETPRLVYELEKYGTVDISLYNIHGQRLRTLHKATSSAGKYKVDINKGGLPQGIYFIHVYHQFCDYIRSKTLKILI